MNDREYLVVLHRTAHFASDGDVTLTSDRQRRSLSALMLKVTSTCELPHEHVHVDTVRTCPWYGTATRYIYQILEANCIKNQHQNHAMYLTERVTNSFGCLVLIPVCNFELSMVMLELEWKWCPKYRCSIRWLRVTARRTGLKATQPSTRWELTVK
jgi:hypothetical protein